MPKKKKVTQEHIITQEELLEDGALLLKLTIPGRPTTKKTHQNAFLTKGAAPRIVVMPSKQYKAYEELCRQFCIEAWSGKGLVPINFGVSIHVRIYLDTWRIGDHVGYLQALGDILEKHGVLADDKFIHWANDGTHWLGGIDKENPRAEIEIKRFRHPYEEYRASKEKR